MTGTLRVLRAEGYRLARRRPALVSLVLLGLASASWVWVTWAAQAFDHARRARVILADGGDPPAFVPENGYGPLVDGWLVGLKLTVVVLAVLAARGLAGDLGGGVLRLASTRSASRTALVLGRALLGVPVLLVTLLVTGGAAWCCARALFPFGPLVVRGVSLASVEDLDAGLLQAALLTLPPLLATWMYGLFVSACFRSAVGAVSTTLVTLLGFDLFKGLMGEARYLVFATFSPSFVDDSCMKEMAGAARGYVDAGYRDELLAMNVVVPSVWALALLLGACAVLARRRL
ncbi:MAG: hypothetical protein H6825_02225 [Planctomycetes bacterium]|nr:hypothetical protein [Planctomycetota bacterium]